jgi:hypothetical protein
VSICATILAETLNLDHLADRGETQVCRLLPDKLVDIGIVELCY